MHAAQGRDCNARLVCCPSNQQQGPHAQCVSFASCRMSSSLTTLLVVACACAPSPGCVVAALLLFDCLCEDKHAPIHAGGVLLPPGECEGASCVVCAGEMTQRRGERPTSPSLCISNSSVKKPRPLARWTPPPPSRQQLGSCSCCSSASDGHTRDENPHTQ